MSITFREIGINSAEEYINCTIEYVNGGYCSISSNGKEIWRGEMLPDQVENMQMHQTRSRNVLLIKNRTSIDGDVKIITLHTGDKVHWTDGDFGTDDIVIEDLVERVVVKSKNTLGEYINLEKERVKFKGVKCLQRKVWG